MAQDYIIKIEGSWPSGETEYVIGTDNPERLPAVSASDNGDVLTVVEGKWQDAAPSAGGLPAVTADDNGDVLTVVDGEWNKAAPSGGGVTVIDFDNDLTAPEIDGVTAVFLTMDGEEYLDWSGDVYIYSGDFSKLATLPIFAIAADRDGVAVDYAGWERAVTFLGSATDPAQGSVEALYLTSDSPAYSLSFYTWNRNALVLPSTATFAVGHFSDE